MENDPMEHSHLTIEIEALRELNESLMDKISILYGIILGCHLAGRPPDEAIITQAQKTHLEANSGGRSSH